MHFPFLFLALTLTAGILFSSLFSPSLQSLVPASIASLVCAWISFFFFRKIKLSLIFILLTTFLLGSSFYTYREKKYEENTLHKFRASSYLDFYGTLYKSPSKSQNRDFLFIKVEKISYLNKEEKISGNLRVSVLHTSKSSPLFDFYVHDRVKVSAKITSFKGFRNFNKPSMNIYLKSLNIHNRAFTKSPLLVEKLNSEKNFSPLRLISIFRQKLQQKIEIYFSGPEKNSISPQGAVLEALLLGERGRIDESTTRSLQKSGLYHLFAISGAHIAIISFLLFSFFKVLRIPTRLSYLLLMLFLVFYAFLVEGRPSVLRATIMTLAFLLGKLIWRNVNLINTLSISAFFLLLINPFSLFSLGFQLTFAATFSIILFFPKIIKFFPRLPLRISEIFVLSLTAQMGVLPFIANAFNRITFSSLVLNCGALPLVGLIMACGYIFLPLSFVSPFLAQITAKAINLFINLLISISHLFDHFPFFSYRIPTPHWLIIIGYFLFLFLLLTPSKIKRQKLIFFICYLGFFAVLITYPFSSKSNVLKLTFIDVGQGDSILIEFPGNKKMLVDGGGVREETFDIGERVVSPFLWKKGIKKIDFLVLTHAHPDHLNGLKSVAKNFKVAEYWEAFSPSENESYTEFRSLLPQTVSCKRLYRNHSFNLRDVRIDVLNPEQKEPYVFFVHNDQSLVLRLSYGQTSFLLTGDIGTDIEEEIIETAREIKSQVLKSPHHGSISSSSEAFLKAVSPQIVVICVGEGNTYGLPDQEVLHRYKEIGAKVYRTDLHGAVEISSDGHKISVRIAFSSK